MANDPSNPNVKSPGIKRIAVTGFKSLATKTDVEIRPLTVLAGANSSGKSSLMQPLLLMKQTLESDFSTAGPFLLSDSYLQFTETKQFLSHVKAFPEPLTVEFDFDEGLTAGMTYSVDPWAGLRVEETWGSNAIKQLKWTIARSSKPEELKSMVLEFSSVPLMMEQVGFTALSVQESGFYLSILYSIPDGSGTGEPGWERRELYQMQENLVLNSHIGRLIYVPGIRGSLSRKSRLAEVDGHGFFPGSFENYAASVVFSWILPGNRHKLHQLINALSALNLASGISPMTGVSTFFCCN
jgi:hypothetical protein